MVQAQTNLPQGESDNERTSEEVREAVYNTKEETLVVLVCRKMKRAIKGFSFFKTVTLQTLLGKNNYGTYLYATDISFKVKHLYKFCHVII